MGCSMLNSALFSSESENWATPQQTFDNLNYVFNFALDACADPINHKCEKYFTKEDNGLEQDWSGNKVFVILHMVRLTLVCG